MLKAALFSHRLVSQIVSQNLFLHRNKICQNYEKAAFSLFFLKRAFSTESKFVDSCIRDSTAFEQKNKARGISKFSENVFFILFLEITDVLLFDLRQEPRLRNLPSTEKADSSAKEFTDTD